MVFKMKIETKDDVIDILRIYTVSAAICTALEFQLFWKLAEKPLEVRDISQMFNIPADRCQQWLELLVGSGLLEKQDNTYFPSVVAQITILESYKPETWTFLAQEAQERYISCNNLTEHISHPTSVWTAQGLKPPNYFTQMMDNSEYAERFTRGLYDFHLQFADKVANSLDVQNVEKMMDVGGGSGVISFALLKRYQNLTSTVVDIDSVCTIGRQIADTTFVADRISYHVADFLKDDLPTGFDMILQCDAGVFSEDFYRKLKISLRDKGRLIIITNLDGFSSWLDYPDCKSPLQRLVTTFLGSLGVPKMKITMIDDIKALLTESGYQDVSHQIWEEGTVIVEGRVRSDRL